MQSEAGKKSRKIENETIENIKDEYQYLFQPFTICDRIGIKDNKIVFIEVKKNKKDKLRLKQQQFKELCKKLGYEYIVVYHE